MNCFKFDPPKLSEFRWKIESRFFLIEPITNFYGRRPTKFYTNKYVCAVLSHDMTRITKGMVWCIRVFRQCNSIRCQKIEGFILFIGIDILRGTLVFEVFYIGRITPISNTASDLFFEATLTLILKKASVTDQRRQFGKRDV